MLMSAHTGPTDTSTHLGRPLHTHLDTHLGREAD